ncbi:MAG TPA: molecular chaperone DnaJ [Thermoanaerobaculia bacterium]|nr:molecular chaperone DnaJ [Thermoanaerobaculia bacterium]
MPSSTTRRDYYEVLGVARDAAVKEIRSAYRRLAVQYHPDRNAGDGGAEERFKEAAEAYAVLSDPEKRARYDRLGHAGVGAQPGFDPTIFADFSDILGDLFGFGDPFGRGRGRRPASAVAGADLRYDLVLGFDEAAFGKEVELRIPRLERCGACSGTGSAGGAPPRTCDACSGRGQIRFSQGFFTVARPCPQCEGSGFLISDPCPECRGTARVERERQIEVKVPAGVEDGARLRLTGEGEHGLRGGPPGDLYVVLHVEAHERWLRDGADVISQESISYPQAVLGAEIEVETLHGPARLEIPPGTEPGRRFTIRSKGAQRLGRSGYGDHVVEVRLAIPAPRELDDDEIELLRRLAELKETPVRERRVLDRVKDLFT